MKLLKFVWRAIIGGILCLIAALLSAGAMVICTWDSLRHSGWREAWHDVLRGIELILFSILAVFWFPWRDRLGDHWDERRGVKLLWSKT